MAISGADINILVGGVRGSCIAQSLSSQSEAKTSSAAKPNQKIIPSGVMIIFSLFLVVAVRYINSAHLSARLIVLLSV
jgi:hypothetical protein